LTLADGPSGLAASGVANAKMAVMAARKIAVSFMAKVVGEACLGLVCIWSGVEGLTGKKWS
jgi:hypothetical protein